MSALGARVGESTLTEKRMAVLKHLHGLGKTLKVCGGRTYLGLSERTLERYACKLGLAFPDYTPRILKPKKAKIVDLMRQYADQGYSLGVTARKLRMKNQDVTKLAVRYGIVFEGTSP